MELEAYIGKSVAVEPLIPEDSDGPTDVLVIIETKAEHPTVVLLASGGGIESWRGLAEICRRYSIG